MAKKYKPAADGWTPRPPDYNVGVMSRKTEYKGTVGAAWLKGDGRIAIKLHPFVVLSAADDLIVTLFPCDQGHAARVDEDPPAAAGDPPTPGTPPGELPF